MKTERLYKVIAIIECRKMANFGKKFYLSDERQPMTHKEACAFMTKLTKHSWRRVMLEEVV